MRCVGGGEGGNGVRYGIVWYGGIWCGVILNDICEINDDDNNNGDDNNN